MNIDNTRIHKYILLDTTQKACYAFISSVNLTGHEAKTKNYAFGLNGVNKKYVLQKDWK